MLSWKTMLGDDEIQFEVAREKSAGRAADFEVGPEAGANAGPGPARSGAELATPTLAELYMKQGHFEQAARIFAQLLSRRPGDAGLLSKLGECQRRLAQTPAGAVAAPSGEKVLRALEGLANAARKAQGKPPVVPATLRKKYDERLVQRLEGWAASARRLQRATA